MKMGYEWNFQMNILPECLLVTGEVIISINENDLYYLSDVIIKDKFLKTTNCSN